MANKLTPEKARLMLKEGVANKHRLTEKQRRYFQMVAHGKNRYETGGWLDKYQDGGEIGQREDFNRSNTYTYNFPNVIENLRRDAIEKNIAESDRNIISKVNDQLSEYHNLINTPLYDPDYLTDYSNSRIFRKSGPYASRFDSTDLGQELNEWNKKRQQKSDSLTNVGIKKYGEPFRIIDKKYNKRSNILYDRGFVSKVKDASHAVGIDPVDAMALIMRESAGGEGRYVEQMAGYDVDWMKYHPSSPSVLTSAWNSYINNPYVVGDIKHEAYANPNMRKYFNKTDFEPVHSNFGNILVHSLKGDVTIPKEVYKMYSDKLSKAIMNYMPFRGELYYYDKNKDTYNKSPEFQRLLNEEKEIIKSNKDLYEFLKSESSKKPEEIDKEGKYVPKFQDGGEIRNPKTGELVPLQGEDRTSRIKNDNRHIFQRLNDRIYSEYQEHKPQLFKDFPITDLPGQTISYLTGHSDPEVALAMVTPVRKLTSIPNFKSWKRGLLEGDIDLLNSIKKNPSLQNLEYHGIAKGTFEDQLNNLDNLLTKGVSKDKTFYTSTLNSYDRNLVRTDSPFLLSMNKDKVSKVFINTGGDVKVAKSLKKLLQKEYKDVKFYTYDEAHKAVENIPYKRTGYEEEMFSRSQKYYKEKALKDKIEIDKYNKAIKNLKQGELPPPPIEMNSIFENGGNVQMKNQEQVLDNLTNFTNLNKKMKLGGWLSKYQ